MDSTVQFLLFCVCFSLRETLHTFFPTHPALFDTFDFSQMVFTVLVLPIQNSNGIRLGYLLISIRIPLLYLRMMFTDFQCDTEYFGVIMAVIQFGAVTELNTVHVSLKARNSLICIHFQGILASIQSLLGIARYGHA